MGCRASEKRSPLWRKLLGASNLIMIDIIGLPTVSRIQLAQPFERRTTDWVREGKSKKILIRFHDVISDHKIPQNDREPILSISVDARWANLRRSRENRRETRPDFFFVSQKKFFRTFFRFLAVLEKIAHRASTEILRIALRSF